MVMAVIIGVDQLREEIGGITDDQRFAEYVTDAMLQDIIDRHTAYFDQRAEEALFSGQILPDSLIHLAEPIQIDMTPGDPVSKGDFPSVNGDAYVRWSFGAFDDQGDVLNYDADILETAENNPFAARRYRIIGSHVECLPNTAESMELYLALRSSVRDSLLGGAHAGLGKDGHDLNREIINEALRMVEERFKTAKREEELEASGRL